MPGESPNANERSTASNQVLKMLFEMCTIILKWSHSPDLIIFRYSCFKIGHSQPRDAYKSVAYKKRVMYINH